MNREFYSILALIIFFGYLASKMN